MPNNSFKIGNLEIKVPVIQGGMGVGVSLSSLAGAVAKEGGIGVISTAQIGYRESDFDTHPIEANLRCIKKEIDKAREIAPHGIVGVNIMVATLHYERYVKAAVEAGVDIIISGAGLPMELPELVAGSKVKIAPIVSSVKSISVITKYWHRKYQRLPDFVVIEGPRAGGHLGFAKDTLAKLTQSEFDEEIKNIITFVKELESVNQVSMPVVVAGGIYTKEDLEHYRKMGARGVQMGTRFVTTYECDASMAYKQAYLNAAKEDVIVIDSPIQMPGRALNNAFIKNSEKKGKQGRCHQCIKHCKPDQIPYCITDALIEAVKGNVDNGLIFCGENGYRAKKLEHVADIMKEFRGNKE